MSDMTRALAVTLGKIKTFLKTRAPCIHTSSFTLQEPVSRHSYSTLMEKMQGPIPLQKRNISEVLSKYDTVLLDCDGVLWHWDSVTPLDGIREGIETLRSMNKRLLFVTNHSGHDRASFVSKFEKLAKFKADKDEVFYVAYAAAVYMKEILQLQGMCYLMGSEGMARELDEVGIPYVGLGPDLEEMSGDADLLLQKSAHLHQDVSAVLVGYDTFFNYAKLFKSTSYLMNKNCAYIATNTKECAAHLGPLCCQPITGSLVAAVTTAAKREPLVIGKPERLLLECIKVKFPNLDPSKTLMVGDSLNSDVPFANNCGMDSLLVLSGITSDYDTKVLDPSKIPTYVTQSIADIYSLVE